MYKVYDRKNKSWVGEETFLSQVGALYVCKKNLFSKKFVLAPFDYIVNNYIGCNDCNGKRIYENDLLKFGDDNILYHVKYSNSMCCYIALDYLNYKYYKITESVCGKMEIAGSIYSNDISKKNKSKSGDV